MDKEIKKQYAETKVDPKYLGVAVMNEAGALVPLKKLTEKDLRKVTWTYDSYEAVGTYLGEVVRLNWWKSPIKTLEASRCNVEEGWLEIVVYKEGKGFGPSANPSEGVEPELTEDGEIKKERIPFKGTLEILDGSGQLIALASNDTEAVSYTCPYCADRGTAIFNLVKNPIGESQGEIEITCCDKQARYTIDNGEEFKLIKLEKIYGKNIK